VWSARGEGGSDDGELCPGRGAEWTRATRCTRVSNGSRTWDLADTGHRAHRPRTHGYIPLLERAAARQSRSARLARTQAAGGVGGDGARAHQGRVCEGEKARAAAGDTKSQSKRSFQRECGPEALLGVVRKRAPGHSAGNKPMQTALPGAYRGRTVQPTSSGEERKRAQGHSAGNEPMQTALPGAYRGRAVRPTSGGEEGKRALKHLAGRPKMRTAP